MTVETNGDITHAEREAQKAYWAEHSTEATVEAMMLDSQAKDIDKLERPEVLRLLGDIQGKRIIELGAGIGRFTGELATNAKSVFALDFMQNLIDQNEANNSHFANVSFSCGDVTELQLPTDSADVVFSNWLLMYLSDEEVSLLAAKMLQWVTEGGHVFFRESCFRQSGDKSRKNNPTHYRNPRDYFKIFERATVTEADGRVAHFDLVCCKSVDTYVRVKQNQNQVCWKWQKVVSAAPESNDFRHFLDSNQYSQQGIAAYQMVFGQGFVSPGGLETAKEFTQLLKLKEDDNVLDVGCGLGGSAVHLARTYGAYVYGIDLSVNMVLTALESAAAIGNGDKVSFEISDCTKRDFPDESFDAVYSRDVLLHIEDKPLLFEKLLKVLKPGGQLLVTDYYRADGELSKDFQDYISGRRYNLVTLDSYGKIIKDAGFIDVSAVDITEQFISCLQKEMERITSLKEDIVEKIGAECFDEIQSNWQSKLARAKSGEQRWGLFRANKSV